MPKAYELQTDKQLLAELEHVAVHVCFAMDEKDEAEERLNSFMSMYHERWKHALDRGLDPPTWDVMKPKAKRTPFYKMRRKRT